MDGGLRSVSNVFDPGIGDIFTDGLCRVFTMGDLDDDGTSDLLVVDYYEDSHYVVAASGSSGNILYSLESVSPDSFYFGVNATPIPDVDEDGVSDYILVSHDSMLSEVDAMVLSGSSGAGIARLVEVSSTAQIGVFQVVPFSDIDKSGTTDTDDIYIIYQSTTSGSSDPGSDVNLDGITDGSDLVTAQSQTGPISASLTARIANALGGTASGSEVTIDYSLEGGLVNWLKAVWDCATCLVNCSDAYDDAWECRDALKQAECDCWELADAFDISECLDDLRLNFMTGCIQDAADAAGACGQCIIDCHPLSLQ